MRSIDVGTFLRCIKDRHETISLPNKPTPTVQSTPEIKIVYAKMQFLISTILALIAFVATASAMPGGGGGECKPVLQSCKVNSVCCSDLCVAGVWSKSFCWFFRLLTSITFSFAFKWISCTISWFQISTFQRYSVCFLPLERCSKFGAHPASATCT